MAKASRKISKSKAPLSIETLVPATDNQRVAVGHLEDFQVVLLEGLAGTGKTYLAVHHALGKLLKNEIDKIIFTRPLTTVGNEKLGFLPGDVGDKTRPFTEQFLEYMEEFSPLLTLDGLKAIEERIEFIPMAYLRGRNFRKAIIIADEMQNSSEIQMKTLLTRITEESQLIILGDTKQEDVKQLGGNGLSNLLYKLQSSPDNPYIGHVKFGYEDIQRGDFVKFVMRLYGDI